MPIMLASPLSMGLCCKTRLVSIAVLSHFSPATLFAFSLVSTAVPIRGSLCEASSSQRYSREAWRTASGSARLLWAAIRSRTSGGVDVLLRQKSVCDDQSHHARENQQCLKGFSDHWPRRMARGR